MNPNDYVVDQNKVMQEMQRQNSEAQKRIAQESVEATPEIKASYEQKSSSTVSSTLTDRIKQMESELGRSSNKDDHSRVSAGQKYQDDYGKVTWYIRNDSGKHIILSDLELTIPKGEIEDLLGKASLEDIEASKDLRIQVRQTGNLKRLTQEEYWDALEDIRMRKKQISAMELEKVSKESTASQSDKIRPLIESQLNKLDLHYNNDPEVQKRGLSPIEFISWVMKEKFEKNEIDYMMGYPSVMKSVDIKAALMQKKASS